MQIRKLLEIQSIIEDRSIPNDIFHNDYMYHCETEQKTMHILDMDLIKFIRAFNKLQDKILELEDWKNYNESCMKQSEDYNLESFKSMFESVFNKGR